MGSSEFDILVSKDSVFRERKNTHWRCYQMMVWQRHSRGGARATRLQCACVRNIGILVNSDIYLPIYGRSKHTHEQDLG